MKKNIAFGLGLVGLALEPLVGITGMDFGEYDVCELFEPFTYNVVDSYNNILKRNNARGTCDNPSTCHDGDACVVYDLRGLPYIKNFPGFLGYYAQSQREIGNEEDRRGSDEVCAWFRGEFEDIKARYNYDKEWASMCDKEGAKIDMPSISRWTLGEGVCPTLTYKPQSVNWAVPINIFLAVGAGTFLAYKLYQSWKKPLPNTLVSLSKDPFLLSKKEDLTKTSNPKDRSKSTALPQKMMGAAQAKSQVKSQVKSQKKISEQDR